MSKPQLTEGTKVRQISTGKRGTVKGREDAFNECMVSFEDLTTGSSWTSSFNNIEIKNIPNSDLEADTSGGSSIATSSATESTPSYGFAGSTATRQTPSYAGASQQEDEEEDDGHGIDDEDLAQLDTLLAANQETAPVQKQAQAFAEGDEVSVYSASQQKWYEDGVIEGTQSDNDGLWYVVRYSNGERQKLIHEYDTGVIKLRNVGEDEEAGGSGPTKGLTQTSAEEPLTSENFDPDDYEAVSPSIFKVGEPVAIYSTSKDLWFPDGNIKRTEDDDDGTWLVVQYNGGSSEKAVNVLDTEIIRGLNFKRDDGLDEF